MYIYIYVYTQCIKIITIQNAKVSISPFRQSPQAAISESCTSRFANDTSWATYEKQ